MFNNFTHIHGGITKIRFNLEKRNCLYIRLKCTTQILFAQNEDKGSHFFLVRVKRVRAVCSVSLILIKIVFSTSIQFIVYEILKLFFRLHSKIQILQYTCV